MKQIFILMLAGIMIFASCSKDESLRSSSNSTANIEYRLQLQSTNITDSSYLKYVSGQASVSDIKFEGTGNKNVSYTSNIAKVVPIGYAIATLGNMDVASGTYNKIKFRMGFAPMAGSSAIEFNGTFAPGSGSPEVPFMIRVDQPFELEFEKQTPTEIEGNTEYIALGILKMDAITQAMPASVFSGATITNGKIVISSASNTNIYNAFWTVFQSLLKVEIAER
jgi:hypothetical protein